MDGSNGKIIELLERIATGQEATRDEVERVVQRVERLVQRVEGVEGVEEHGFASVNTRLDNMLGFLGRHHTGHEQRITGRVFKKPRRTG